jgi:hypothetical protein
MSPRRLVLAVLVLLVLASAPVFAASPAPTAAPANGAAGAVQPPFDGPDFTPAPQPTAPPCSTCDHFTSSPGGGQASHWGHGTSCTASQSDVRAQLLAYANAVCDDIGDYGRCAFAVIYTNACWYDYGSGLYVTDAYTDFGCWVSWC